MTIKCSTKSFSIVQKLLKNENQKKWKSSKKLIYKVDFTTVQNCCNNKEATIKSIASKHYACIKLAKSILGKQLYRNEGDKHSKIYNSKDTRKKR